MLPHDAGEYVPELNDRLSESHMYVLFPLSRLFRILFLFHRFHI